MRGVNRIPWVVCVAAGLSIAAAVSASGAPAAEMSVADAVKARDAATLSGLLKQKADVNLPQKDGTTALHWAAYNDDATTVDLLLRAGAKAEVANRYGITPLIVACTNANAAIAQMLLKAGANANATAGEGEPVLVTAAQTGDAKVVQLLIDHGANVNATEARRQQTPLILAAVANGALAVQELLNAGALVDKKSQGGLTALHLASREGSIDAARVLLENGADVNMRTGSKSSPIMLGVSNAHYELAAMLLDWGANPSEDGLGYSPLDAVVWAHHPNVVNVPPGPEFTGKMGNLDYMGLARLLIAHGADVNARMVVKGHKPGGPYPPDGYRSSMNRDGATALMMAARVPDVELMQLLLDNGADPTIQTTDHTTLLMVAAGWGWQAGESPEAKPGALMAAVKLAMKLGGDPWWKNDLGYTVLHNAVIRESNELIQYFVDLGADLYAKTNEEDPRYKGIGEGKTPLEVAQGQMINASVKYYPEQEAYLRKIMGLPPAPKSTTQQQQQ